MFSFADIRLAVVSLKGGVMDPLVEWMGMECIFTAFRNFAFCAKYSINSEVRVVYYSEHNFRSIKRQLLNK